VPAAAVKRVGDAGNGGKVLPGAISALPRLETPLYEFALESYGIVRCDLATGIGEAVEYLGGLDQRPH
jgi:hypothetical protein